MYLILIVFFCGGVRRVYEFSECMSPQWLSMASLVKNDLSIQLIMASSSLLPQGYNPQKEKCRIVTHQA